MLLINKKFFRYRLQRSVFKIRHVLSQISEEEVWANFGQKQSSIANLILHIRGSLDQWILHPKGKSIEKRSRPKEFLPEQGLTKDELLAKLEETVSACVDLLLKSEEADFVEVVRLATVREAWGLSVLNVVTHAEGHAMQIVTLGKMLKGDDWLGDASVQTDPYGGW